jgi:hypothetical protein
MEIEFDRFIQDHFFQLDALENGLVPGEEKGEFGWHRAIVQCLTLF